MTKPAARAKSTSKAKLHQIAKSVRVEISKRGESAPLVVKNGAAGGQKLVPAGAIPMDGTPNDLLVWAKKHIEEAIAGIDKSMLFEVSSGSFATFIFKNHIHRAEGLTQVEFSLRYFGRSDRTVLGWRDSHKIWTRLGEQLVCPPSNYSQLLSLKKVQSMRQKEVWNTLVSRLGRAPTGLEIDGFADPIGALLPTSSKVAKSSAMPFELGQIDSRLRAIAEEMRKMASSKRGDDRWKRVGQLAKDLEKCLEPRRTDAKEKTATSDSPVGVKDSKELNMAA